MLVVNNKVKKYVIMIKFKFILRRFGLHFLIMVLIHLVLFIFGWDSPAVLIIITSIEVVFFIVDLLYHLVR